VIGADEVPSFLGPPRYLGDELHTAAEIGTGQRAWPGRPYGGEVLHIEAQTMAGKGSLILTGQLGDVMKESAQTALSFARAYALTLGCRASSTRAARSTSTSRRAASPRTDRRRA
jgi:ATP-dependent Lon protease